MSRKKVSRTIIEGGRSHRNIFDRRWSHRLERAATRAWLDRVRLDSDAVEASCPRGRPRVHKDFSDKLGPARRWLDRQVGRPWAKVYSELFARFDPRSTAGRHIIHDHVLDWVARSHPEISSSWNRPEFLVDGQGLLRRSRWYRPTWSRLRRETEAWARGRRAAVTHRGWWWLWMRPDGPPCLDWRCVRRHEQHQRSRYHALRPVPDGAMSRGDLRRLLALPPELQARIVVAGVGFQ